MLTTATSAAEIIPHTKHDIGKEVNLMTVPQRLHLLIDRFIHDEDGQGLAEYALILALIAVVAIAALLFMGSQVSDKLTVIGTTLQSVQN
jgi:pilus assembly protein Flp/PilA